MSTTLRTALPFAIACSLLASCAGQREHAASIAPVTSEQTPTRAPSEHKRAPRTTTESTTTATSPSGNAQSSQMPDQMVGVAACDQYLSTYKACHRAAHIFAPDQIDARYDMMRNSLLRDSQDPAKRASLDQRCRALANQLTDALHGKSCNAAPNGG